MISPNFLWFEDSAKRPHHKEIRSKIDYILDPKLELIFPGQMEYYLLGKENERKSLLLIDKV